MRMYLLAAAAVLSFGASMASAQDSSGLSTSFRGFRIEGNAGWDRYKSVGDHDSKFGYGGTVGFDGMIGNRIVIGPEASYWTANHGAENCAAGDTSTICNKGFEEWGAAVRAGYLVTPQTLVFAKGGFVRDKQSDSLYSPAGELLGRDRYRTDGYQVGGGVEYTLSQLHTPVPVYVNAQYVYSNYDDHTSRQRVMGGIGIRFK
jgi:outer membrane immunogenic protein